MVSCRYCGSDELEKVLDLGTSPPANAYLNPDQLAGAELWHPLSLHFCPSCLLVQVGETLDRDDLFSPDYAYFSSTSSSFLAHCERYAETIARRLDLNKDSRVVELASNDGYLLQFFKRMGIPGFGVEPTRSTAEHARRRHGLEVVEAFFGEALGYELASVKGLADLIIANNVLAHVPDIGDFMRGVARLLGPQGVFTAEFPSVTELVDHGQFDTIYHEHYSYLSLSFIERLARDCGLRLFDVERLDVHGGSLRVFLSHAAAQPERTGAVDDLLGAETAAGIGRASFYTGLQARALDCKTGLLRFLLDAQTRGASVAAYGAAAKGNTLLNYAGVRGDLIAFVSDRSPSKQGRFMPGSRIPIHHPYRLQELRPDYLLILPWNIADEIVAQEGERLAAWGGQFAVAAPSFKVLAP